MFMVLEAPYQGLIVGPAANWRRTILTGHAVAGATGAQTPTPTRGAQATQSGGEALLSIILSSLAQDGAEEVLDIDLAGKTTVADHMVVASGRSTRHVSAIAEKLMEKIKHDAGVIGKIEGRAAADWVLIDAGDVIVHIFRPEVREFYQLEKMWMTTPDKTARPA